MCVLFSQWVGGEPVGGLEVGGRWVSGSVEKLSVSGVGGSVEDLAVAWWFVVGGSVENLLMGRWLVVGGRWPVGGLSVVGGFVICSKQK